MQLPPLQSRPLPQLTPFLAWSALHPRPCLTWQKGTPLLLFSLLLRN
jgi:hypothetical protein